MRRCGVRSPMTALKWITAAALVAMLAFPAQAHRSGCHRWHSCPSDRGTYVCGDLGYDTYCPKKRTPTRTQPTIQAPTATPPSSPPPAAGLKLVGKSSVMVAQNLLAVLGHDPGPADGVVGPITRAAIRLFQARQGLNPDGKLSMELLVRMSQAVRAKQ